MRSPGVFHNKRTPNGARLSRMLAASRIQKVGPFLVGDRLGVGGMAEVFSAEAPDGSRVALKRILPALAEDQEFCEMFWDEAKVMSRLQHPNIIQVLDYGATQTSRTASELYMSLEFVDGPSVARLLRKAARERKAVNYHAVVELGCQLLDALDYVHSALDEEGRPLGIVHRDVSPGNVLLTSQGQVKLGDFGIVRSEIVARRTQPGELKGKMGYMSPEQARGAAVDARSDLFSVGIILAELLTLRPLFLGKDELETLKRTTCADLSTFYQFNHEVPQLLCLVVEKALQRLPAERYESAQAMKASLEAAGSLLPPLPERDSRPTLRIWLEDLQFVSEGSSAQSGERPLFRGRSLAPGERVTPIHPALASSAATQQLLWSKNVSHLSLPYHLAFAFGRARTGEVHLRDEQSELRFEIVQGRIIQIQDSRGRFSLGRLLLEESILSSAQIVRAIGESRRREAFLGEVLVEEGLIRPSVMQRLLQVQLERRFAAWSDYQCASLQVWADPQEAEPAGESALFQEQAPDYWAQLVKALRQGLSRESCQAMLQPALTALVLPQLSAWDVSCLGLTTTENRALSTVLVGSSTPERTLAQCLEQVVEAQLAPRADAEFAFLVGLATRWIYASGYPSSR